MKAYRITRDSSRYMSLHFDFVKIVEKMPNFRPRFFATPFKEQWQVIEAELFAADECAANSPAPDLSLWTTGALTLNQSAFDKVSSYIERFGEFLPFTLGGQDHYTFNPLYVLDNAALDLTQARELTEHGIYAGMENYRFKPEAMEKEVIFKTSADRGVNCYCTETFKSLVEAHGLTGLVFEEM